MSIVCNLYNVISDTLKHFCDFHISLQGKMSLLVKRDRHLRLRERERERERERLTPIDALILQFPQVNSSFYNFSDSNY